ncbi:phage antirepressor N-terminal domain-containing protein, partial [Acinetobacter baumannii]
NQPFTAMRPIVEGMGLTWQSQYEKLKQRFSSVITEIVTTGKDGKQYNMVCLPVRKLFGWLMTISPNKVNPEIRDTVIMYQQECDDVL